MSISVTEPHDITTQDPLNWLKDLRDFAYHSKSSTFQPTQMWYCTVSCSVCWIVLPYLLRYCLKYFTTEPAHFPKGMPLECTIPCVSACGMLHNKSSLNNMISSEVSDGCEKNLLNVYSLRTRLPTKMLQTPHSPSKQHALHAFQPKRHLKIAK